jgi:hypothetical protein
VLFAAALHWHKHVMPGCVLLKTPCCFCGKRTARSGARKGPQVRVDVYKVGAQCGSIAPSVIALHASEGARAIVHFALVVHNSLRVLGGI